MTAATTLKPPRAYPPFRMRASDAAYYCGMSLSAFYRAVEMKELPAGRKTIGGRYWLRNDLEAAMVEHTQVQQHNFSDPI